MTITELHAVTVGAVYRMIVNGLYWGLYEHTAVDRSQTCGLHGDPLPPRYLFQRRHDLDACGNGRRVIAYSGPFDIRDVMLEPTTTSRGAGGIGQTD